MVGNRSNFTLFRYATLGIIIDLAADGRNQSGQPSLSSRFFAAINFMA